MTDYKDIVRDVTKHSDQVRKLTRPLKDHFGITYFYHVRIDIAGRIHILSNQPEIEEFYFSDKMYTSDPYTRHPNNFQSGFLNLESNGPDEWRDCLEGIRKVFDFSPYVTLIEKNAEFFDFFGFWKDSKSKNRLDKLHLNHTHLLKSFTSHLKKEMRPALLEMKKTTNYIQDLVGKDYFYANLPINLTIEQSTLRAYLMDMGLGNEILKADSLSKREKQCLKLLVLCKTAKEIAIELGLSPRTVEKHLDNSKNKLSCWSKQELFSATRHLEDLGLI